MPSPNGKYSMAGPSHLINWDFPLAPTPPPLARAWFVAAAAFETPPGVSAHHANTPGKHPAPPTTALIRGCFGGVLARSQLQFGRSQGILDGLRWQLGLEIFTLHLSFFGVPNIDFFLGAGYLKNTWPNHLLVL